MSLKLEENSRKPASPSEEQTLLEPVQLGGVFGDSFIEALKKLFAQYKSVDAALNKSPAQKTMPPGATKSFSTSANPNQPPRAQTIQVDYLESQQRVEFTMEPGIATLKTSDNKEANAEQVYLFLLAARTTQPGMLSQGFNIMEGTSAEKALVLAAAKDLGLHVTNEAELRRQIPNDTLEQAKHSFEQFKKESPEVPGTAKATFGNIEQPTVGKLRNALNQTAGDILIDAGILTQEQSDHVGRVQAELVAIRDRIDTPDFKTADGKWNEAKVNAIGLRLGGKFNEPDLFPLMKDGAQRANIVAALKIDGDAVQNALALVNSKQGINAQGKLGVPPILKVIGLQYPGIVTKEFEDAVPTAHAAIRGLETILRLSNDTPDAGKQKQAQGTVQATLKFDANPDGTAKPGKEDVVTAANAAKTFTDLEERRLQGENVDQKLAAAIRSHGPALADSLRKAQDLYKTLEPLGSYAGMLADHYKKTIPGLNGATAAPGSAPSTP